jgi:hypothetical protein
VWEVWKFEVLLGFSVSESVGPVESVEKSTFGWAVWELESKQISRKHCICKSGRIVSHHRFALVFESLEFNFLNQRRNGGVSFGCGPFLFPRLRAPL